MKKKIAIGLILLLIAGTFAGCGQAPEKNDRLKIVTTIFPEYDWVREIVGDRAEDAEITLLLDNGVDLHSYQPTAKDMVTISTCDMFVYVGGESDAWVEDVLKQVKNKNMVAVSLLDSLGNRVKTEEIKEGMQAEEEEESDEEEPENDEHVWLSLKNAVTLCRAIAEKLGDIDPKNKSVYRDNADTYTAKLTALDEEYQEAVDDAAGKVLLFGDRFPFRYLVEDYGLDYYAAFVGCSAESEASFETVVFLAKKTDELGLHTILQTESSDGSLAKTIRENTRLKNQTIAVMDSLQSATSATTENGKTYYTAMEENLSVLKDALR